jgi:hypothetical protein
MNKVRRSLMLCGAVGLLALGAVFASAAQAAPAWKFNGTALSGSETILGAAVSSSLTVPGVTTSCEHFLYGMKIENSGGTGKGSVTELPLFECHTNTPVCTVEAIEAENLPWPAHLTTVAGKNYIVIEGVRVSILYGGEECAVGETEVPVTGSAAGLLENSTETATFNAASFSATGVKLKVGATAIEWNGVFPTEAFAWHRLEALSAS